ncbi:N-acetylmuramoyl-L-alanine amidase [Streptomyces piniterrae]|uniref:N-acetylmuramoyl-L-alanine amidase n=1 Tax=Streptomyces piniterrae TaxID=2571125 RepID=A0A4V5MJP3_9ACTN|nr:peptidoglycan recognition protein [Streptomyces piniterrae]TJZ42558.1 N-acetylmuramoyl-L-alanine amidase [Streptomyces piniterrae]
MRSLLVTCLGVACAAALAPGLAPTAAGARTGVPRTAGHSPAASEPPGSTQSLPIAADPGPTARRALGDTSPAPGSRGLTAHPVRPFSLVGVVWDDADAELHGRIQVRTRPTGTAAWSPWQDVQPHHDDAPDLDAADRYGTRVRGSTAPLWVGESDAVQLRITPAPGRRARGDLPRGLRLELVDPGAAPPAPAAAAELPALDKAASEEAVAKDPERTAAHRYVGPRPRIVTRAGWGADESLRRGDHRYTDTVRAAFVHHSASGNNYTCAQAPSVIRAIYRYDVQSTHWRDMGYNFLVDKCGTVYEGRAGGVTEPVLGAHTRGFNENSMGVAVLGTFATTEPPRAAVRGVARLTAWKLGLYGADPRGTTRLTSAGGNRFEQGREAGLNVISGHRDGFHTHCPGTRLYEKLGQIRDFAAQLQGR